uniref:Protein halfway n=1 Tax=Zeugodacus cucurbitae TaxID=28588 RepID=A0A0A1WPV5_ZEUCU
MAIFHNLLDKYPTQSHLLFVVICLFCWPGSYALPHPAEELPMALPQEPLPNGVLDFQPPPLQNLLPLPKIVATTSLPPAESEIIEYRPQCFYAEEELCDRTLSNWQQQTYDQHTHLGTCHCRPYTNMPTSWYCCNITHMSMISSCSNTTTWTNLHLRNVTLAELDLSNFLYQKLQSLAITDGNITKLVGSFSRFSSIKCLNVSNNNLSEITQRGLIPPTLKVLDISKNNLTSIPNFNQNQNITVDVSGNNNMLCYDIYNSIFRDSLKFVNQQNSYCLHNSSFHWFNSTDLISIKELVKSRPLNTDCPSIPGYGNCTCKNEHMVATLSGDNSEATTKIISEVDCSNLGLIELPPKLPENTFSLNVSNNKITSIGKHFHTNPTYRNLIYLIADNNNISKIYDFEGTVFMDHFQRLYLRNNAISSIPEYFLSNVLDNHDEKRIILLGGNELKCDCNSAKTLKYWLLEHNRDIPDYNSIRCRNLPRNVMELREEKLCQSPHD